MDKPNIRFDAGERPRGIWRAVACGSGAFPYDMLRYDRCWPATSMDVQAAFSKKGERRRVVILSYWPFTEERWRSFGWKVESC